MIGVFGVVGGIDICFVIGIVAYGSIVFNFSNFSNFFKFFNFFYFYNFYNFFNFSNFFYFIPNECQGRDC